MIETVLVTSLLNMHFPLAALIGCLTTVVLGKICLIIAEGIWIKSLCFGTLPKKMFKTDGKSQW